MFANPVFITPGRFIFNSFCSQAKSHKFVPLTLDICTVSKIRLIRKAIVLDGSLFTQDGRLSVKSVQPG